MEVWQWVVFITIPYTHIPLYLKAEQYVTGQKSKSGKLRKKEKLQFKFTLERKSKKWIFQYYFFPLFSSNGETVSERNINEGD